MVQLKGKCVSFLRIETGFWTVLEIIRSKAEQVIQQELFKR